MCKALIQYAHSAVSAGFSGMQQHSTLLSTNQVAEKGVLKPAALERSLTAHLLQAKVVRVGLAPRGHQHMVESLRGNTSAPLCKPSLPQH